MKFVEQYRIQVDGYEERPVGSGVTGAYQIPTHDRDGILNVIVSDGDGWDHVSVHKRINGAPFLPRWDDMLYMKRVFFLPDEWVIQYMPPSTKNINVHPCVLHMWRPQNGETIAKPPEWMV